MKSGAVTFVAQLYEIISRIRSYRLYYLNFALVILMYLNVEDISVVRSVQWYCQHKFIGTKSSLI